MIGVHLKSYHDAKAEERRYERFADDNWSEVTCAKWLVDYHEHNPFIDKLQNKIDGMSANYDPDSDWQ